VPPAPEMIISSAESEVKTTFLGEVSFEFDGKEILGYIWDESNVAGGGPVLNSTFFPGIGLYTSFGDTDSLQLFLVNKQSLGEFLPDFAKGKVRLRNAQPQQPVAPVTPPVPQPAQPEKPAENPAPTPTPPVVQPQTPPTPEPARARQYVLDDKGYYTVQPGDNLYQICQGLQADVETVKRLNNFNGEGLRVGQKLLIKGSPVAVTPPAPAAPPATPAPAAIDGVHIVRAGENLYDIADRYGVSIGTLMTLNRLQAFDLTAGQQIVYREGAKPQKPVREARIGYHLVQPGETLSSIAQRYSTTPNELIAWNRLTDARIQEGQELRVQRPAPETPTAQPASAPKGFHLVQAGESLTDIAQRYRITPEDLIRWNELQQEPVAGQLLRIAAPAAASEPAPVKPTPAPAAAATTHTVQKGQTLTSIARQHGMGVDALRKLNRLTSDNLYVGQVLALSAQTSPTKPQAEKPRTLPVPAEPTKPRPTAQPQAAYHAVQKGDNLNAIAKKYGTTTEALVKLNQLKNPNDIRIGQKLRVK
jgi:LysM repeat protein